MQLLRELNKMNIYSKKSIQKAMDSDDIEADDAGFMLGYLEMD